MIHRLKQIYLWITRLRIRARITLGFSLVLSVSIPLAIIGNMALHHTVLQFDQFTASFAQLVKILEIEQRIIDLQRRVLTYTYSDYEGMIPRIHVLIVELRTALTDAHISSLSNEERHNIQQMSAILERYAYNFNFIVEEKQIRNHWIDTESLILNQQLKTHLDYLAHTHHQKTNVYQLLLSNTQQHLLLAERYALEFGHISDGALAQQVRIQLAAVIINLQQLAAISEPAALPIIEQLNKITALYEKKLTGMIQTMRTYLHLVYVVMAGESAELTRLSTLLKEYTLAQQQAVQLQLTRSNQKNKQLIFLISSAAILITLILAWLISRSITRPLLKISQTLTDLTHGQIQAPIPYQNRCDEIGAIAHAANVFRDAVRKKEHAEAANREKSLFLAHISHELRTPLTAILGFSQLLTKMPDTPVEQHRYLTIINRSGNHLLTIINNILDLSKIEAGQIELQQNRCDLWQLLDDLVAIFMLKAEQQGLLFHFEHPSQMSYHVELDAAKLKQVLINLLGNAIKFTKQGSVRLQVNIHHKTPSQSLLICTISDTGIGIAPTHLTTIFEPFIQLDYDNDNKGTGLGLAICQRLITLMQGDIHVDSVLGKGTTFTVTVPVHPIDNSRCLELARSDHTTDFLPNETQYRILNIEDDHNNRLLLTQLLTALGFQVYEAENGSVGVQAFETWQPHLIFMDIRMPVLDGYQALALIRNKPGGQQCKIIALTANCFHTDQQHLLASGFNDVLAKPYHSIELYQLLKRHLDFTPTQTLPHEANLMPAAVTTADHQAISPALLDELRGALIHGDSEHIHLLLQTFDIDHPLIATQLRTWIADYQYQRVLDWLDQDNFYGT
jgi:signal transduction histidine kinase/CheY-like chemotaxis protein